MTGCLQAGQGCTTNCSVGDEVTFDQGTVAFTTLACGVHCATVVTVYTHVTCQRYSHWFGVTGRGALVTTGESLPAWLFTWGTVAKVTVVGNTLRVMTGRGKRARLRTKWRLGFPFPATRNSYTGGATLTSDRNRESTRVALSWEKRESFGNQG